MFGFDGIGKACKMLFILMLVLGFDVEGEEEAEMCIKRARCKVGRASTKKWGEKQELIRTTYT